MEQFLSYVWALLIAYVWNRVHERACLASLSARQVGTDDQWHRWNLQGVTKLSLMTT